MSLNGCNVFIKDAEEKQVEDAMIRKWVSDIRDIAYDTEDVLDNFMLKIDHGKTPSKMKDLYGIGKEIESVQKGSSIYLVNGNCIALRILVIGGKERAIILRGVIITTRIKEVAERSDERNHVQKLRFLRPDESWNLFCEKSFRKSNANEELEKLGREMVEKCGGLPLA
ncbi:putative disease resistance RPP13-like protein 3 [Pistacia vera]|uniref:putative disease resistance RPP13-like protein 3 n=1 Tax=Pistacia vera TaxID=55513 RepID=UPI001263CC21|nr:putative disease resistance RPP13-like protein 3 [Pistacia vera]